MSAAFLITLREGLEAAIIVAIVMAYLRQLGRSDQFVMVGLGALAGAAVAIAAGAGIYLVIGELEGRAEELTEAFIGFGAVAVLTWMVFWMRRQARSMGGALRSQVNHALERGAVLGMASIAFIGVAREGLETALYMLTVFFDFGVVSTMIGAVAGMAAAAALGYAFYRSSQSINLRLFFQLTAGLIILFAAGLLGRSIFHLQAAGVFDSLYWPVWDVAADPIVGHGNIFAFLSGLFGWSSQPSLEQAAAWAMYVTLACWFFYFDGQLPEVVAERVRPWANAVARTFALGPAAEADVTVDRDG